MALFTNCISLSREGKAIGGICPSVCPFVSLYLLKWLTYELEFFYRTFHKLDYFCCCCRQLEAMYLCVGTTISCAKTLEPIKMWFGV